jgi:DNA-binding transcriptional ArsR family regulator
MNEPTTLPVLTERQFELVAKALADPRRMALLESVACCSGECSCQSLVDRFPVSKGTISHHMKELIQAGLVTTRKEGSYRFYDVQREVLASYSAELLRRVGMGQS